MIQDKYHMKKNIVWFINKTNSVEVDVLLNLNCIIKRLLKFFDYLYYLQ